MVVFESVASPFGLTTAAEYLLTLEDELVPALTIKDSVASPLPYKCFLTIQILDCYSDPPGWKDQLAGSGNFTALPNEALVSSTANVFTEVKHMDKLYNSIIELGEDQISRIFWLLHSDLHEARVRAVLEYLSSMVASLEPSHQLANGQRGHLENFSLIKHNSKKGKFHSAINFTSLPSEGAINQGLVPKKTTMLGNIPSPFATEAMVCFQAAVMGLQMDLSRVEIKDDSFTFIRKLQANRVERSILGAYICNIKTICIRFQMCQNKQMKGLNYWLLSD
ncbi:hypothetical protein GOBAR_AA37009 [Gossypium barbadense]|uniref:Elongator complex protein 5 n=1 Tax=Gossypium barbadense TaxID=3634 RepID=A0A2P5VXX7_GOSBA|nr:hypothetical protein GOBAR_AA37009 [Gossypium barbadense]